MPDLEGYVILTFGRYPTSEGLFMIQNRRQPYKTEGEALAEAERYAAAQAPGARVYVAKLVAYSEVNAVRTVRLA